MERPLAVYHVKPHRLPAWGQPGPGSEPGFTMELEHRVWLVRFGARHADPLRYRWDAALPDAVLPDAVLPDAVLPETWLHSPLSTVGFGGSFRRGELRPRGRGVDPRRAWGPLPGDRVVAYRRGPQDVVGVWLVTGARFAPDGEALYSVRPILSCAWPVALPAQRRHDADLDEAWESTFGRAGVADGPLVPLDGPALSGVLRSVGIDPRSLCGPLSGLAGCSPSNRPPAPGFRPATRLQTVLSQARRADERAAAEAVDWIEARSLPGFGRGEIDVETVGVAGAAGLHLVARCGDLVHQVVAVGTEPGSTELEDLELCPTVVHQAVDAAREGRRWSLMVTLDPLGAGRTVRLDAPAVALCFDSRSGRVAHRDSN